MSSSTRHQSYFKFQQVPPPLPPLDHPAFQINEFGVLPRATPSAFNAEKVVRPSNSLPSFRKWPRSSTKADPGMHTIRRKGTRHRSKSSVADNRGPDLAIRNAFHHFRTSSKTSIDSIRRSSAEYSAKQASSLDHDHDGCWEVGVSKAMINLSLGDQRISASASTLTAATADAFPDRPRGENRTSSDRIVTLGSPFFLQDQLPRNFINNRVFNDNHASAKSRHGKKGNIARDGIKLMAKTQVGEIVTPITTSSSDPAARLRQSSSESAGSSKSNNSRRGEGRTRTSSSGTPPQRKVDSSQTHAFASIQSSLFVPQLSITRPTPEPSPISPISPSPTRRHKSTPTMPPKSILPPVIEKSYSSGSVKRKAETDFVEGDKTPPRDTKENRATFAPEPKTQRLSASSLLAHAPSSYNRSKRVRLTDSSEGGRSSSSRPGLRANTSEESPPNSKNTGSWSSRGSHGPRPASSYTHTHSHREGPPLARSASRASHSAHGHRAPSRRSLSQVSIPISALVSPHAPSITHSGKFHMRDPRKPARIQNTPWSLSFPTSWEAGQSRWETHSWVARGGSPLHAWFFFIGFVLFPLWWVAAFISTPMTRRLGGTDAEKGVMLDDPQVEHDAKSWRYRCRVMAIVSLITYIPFIALIVVFTRR